MRKFVSDANIRNCYSCAATRFPLTTEWLQVSLLLSRVTKRGRNMREKGGG